jgi:hypothetical protein
MLCDITIQQDQYRDRQLNRDKNALRSIDNTALHGLCGGQGRGRTCRSRRVLDRRESDVLLVTEAFLRDVQYL